MDVSLYKESTALTSALRIFGHDKCVKMIILIYFILCSMKKNQKIRKSSLDNKQHLFRKIRIIAVFRKKPQQATVSQRFVRRRSHVGLDSRLWGWESL